MLDILFTLKRKRISNLKRDNTKYEVTHDKVNIQVERNILQMLVRMKYIKLTYHIKVYFDDRTHNSSVESRI